MPTIISQNGILVSNDLDSALASFPAKHLVLHIHGGLVNEEKATKSAKILTQPLGGDTRTPVFFIWRSGPMETFLDRLLGPSTLALRLGNRALRSAAPLATTDDDALDHCLTHESARSAFPALCDAVVGQSTASERSGLNEAFGASFALRDALLPALTLPAAACDAACRRARARNQYIVNALNKGGNLSLRARLQPLWDQMKQNLETCFSGTPNAVGTSFLAALADRLQAGAPPPTISIIAHSAGSIFALRLIQKAHALNLGVRFHLYLLAPAATFALLNATAPALHAHVTKLELYGLTSCREETALVPPSLLTLLARVFEGTSETPILGMERYHNGCLTHPSIDPALTLLSNLGATKSWVTDRDHSTIDDYDSSSTAPLKRICGALP